MPRIAESELIINSRGAVYHLDMRPEELADTVILVGDPNRVAKISSHFDSIESKQAHREFISHTGILNRNRLTVLSTGIGPDNIDITLNELDALVNIDFDSREIKNSTRPLNIIRFGTSGALQEDIPVDSLVASTHGIGLDNLLNYYEYAKGEAEQNLAQSFIKQIGLSNEICIPYVFSGSADLLSRFQTGYVHGITVTCPGFYGPQGRVLRLPVAASGMVDRLSEFRQDNLRITNFEMETSAIYGLGSLLGHHCMSINVIVANRLRKEFSKDSDRAVAKMIQHSLDCLLA